jgi:hypothetical protein
MKMNKGLKNCRLNLLRKKRFGICSNRLFWPGFHLVKNSTIKFYKNSIVSNKNKGKFKLSSKSRHRHHHHQHQHQHPPNNPQTTKNNRK